MLVEEEVEGDNGRGGSRMAIKPPDGGFGWLVVFASFMIHVVADGVAYSFGLFFVEISRDDISLQEGKSSASWIGSILLGVTFGTGPIAGAFVTRYGCRAVSIAGSLVAAAGFAVSYYATSVAFLYVSVGVCAGLGLGLIYLPAIVCVSCYFEKRRALATGIAVCGSGVGTFLFGPLTNFLIKTLGWRTSFLAVAGIMLNCIFFALMFRPLTPASDDTNSSSNFPNPNYEPDSSATTMVSPPTSDGKESPHQRNHRNHGGSIEMMPIKYLTEDKVASDSLNSLRKIDSLEEIALKTDSIVSDGSGFGSQMTHNHFNQNGASRQGTIITPRKDVFFSCSVSHIPDVIPDERTMSSDGGYGGHTRTGSTFDLHQPFAFSRERGDDDVRVRGGTEGDRRLKLLKYFRCSPELTEVLKAMVDFSLLRNPVFLFFVVSNLLTNVGYNVPYIYLADMAKENLGLGHDDHSLGLLVSSIGFSNTISRVVLGYLSDQKWVNRLYLYASALTLCGIATALSVHANSFNWLIIYGLIFGCTGGVYVGLTSVILVDLVGLGVQGDTLSKSFGIVLLFQGIGTVIGPPIVGALFDIFANYVFGFSLAGITIAISGAMLFLIPCIQRQMATRRRRNTDAHLNRRSSSFLY